jgi:hypothetical protein
VNRTVASCFAVLRQIRSVRRSLPTSAVQTSDDSRVIGPQQTRLRQRSAHQAYGVSATTPNSYERCGSYHRRLVTPSSCQRQSCSLTLAEGTGAHQIQTGRHHLSLLAQHGATLPRFTNVPDRGHSCEKSTSIICWRPARCLTVTPNH